MAHGRHRAENGGIVNGPEGKRGEGDGTPRESGLPLLRNEVGGHGERVGDEHVGVFHDGVKLVVGLPEVGHDHLADEVDGAVERVHDFGHELILVAEIGDIGAGGVEAEAGGFDFLPVGFHGGDGDRVAALPEADGDGEIGVEIAEGTDGGQDDVFCGDPH